MPGAEGKVHVGHQAHTQKDKGDGSVLAYVTEPEFRKQRSRSPSCNSLLKLFGWCWGRPRELETDRDGKAGSCWLAILHTWLPIGHRIDHS